IPMKKNPNLKFGIFNPRVLLAFAFCASGVLLAMIGFAAAPTPFARQELSGASPSSPVGAKYYFHGTMADDANRLAGTPSATFDFNAPTGSGDVTQTG